MKKFKKLISIFISIMVFFSATACTSPKPEEESYKEQNVTDKYIVQNGQTDYVIVVPENTPSTIKEAASELIYFFKEATNITLEQCTDNGLAYAEENKYISLGYRPILVLEKEEIDLFNIENLISPSRLKKIQEKNIKKL